MDWLDKITAQHLLTGYKAEKIGCKFLCSQGLRIVEKNYRCRHGEIDLVMQDMQYLVFVEIRYRKSTDFGLPQQTVGIRKQKKIIKSAQNFLLNNKMGNQCPCRFDIVAIHGTIPNHKINWIKNAFYVQT